MKRRSIGERLARAGSLSVRREIAHDWHANWVQDHDAEVRAIERALQRRPGSPRHERKPIWSS